MSTVTGDRTEIDTYVEAVRSHLEDLPADEREDVLEDLRTHLAEVAAECDEPLVRRLGAPDAYAAELRASAGYGPSETRKRRQWRDLLAHPRIESMRRFLPELQPGWWVVRAIVVVSAAAVWNGATRQDFPVPDLGGSPFLTFVAIAAALPLSVAVGRRSRWGSIVWSVVAVVTGVIALTQVERSMPRGQIVFTAPAPVSSEMRAVDGRPIFNIYPFAADGTPLENVLLYDQDGVPLDNLAGMTRGGIPVDRRYRTTSDGRPITNSYPQQVFLPGIGAAPRVDQRPPVSIPPPPPPAPTP